MIERRAPSELDGAVDRAASAARALAAVAHNAARKYVKRDAVTPQSHGVDSAVMVWAERRERRIALDVEAVRLDAAERERQARLRRWHQPAHPNRKDG